ASAGCRKRLRIQMLSAAGDHGKGVCCRMGINTDDIRIVMCDDSGHSDAFLSVPLADRISFAIAWHHARRETHQGRTVMSHNEVRLDKLLIRPLKWTGRCRPTTMIGQFTSKTLPQWRSVLS